MAKRRKKEEEKIVEPLMDNNGASAHLAMGQKKVPQKTLVKGKIDQNLWSRVFMVFFWTHSHLFFCLTQDPPSFAVETPSVKAESSNVQALERLNNEELGNARLEPRKGGLQISEIPQKRRVSTGRDDLEVHLVPFFLAGRWFSSFCLCV